MVCEKGFVLSFQKMHCLKDLKCQECSEISDDTEKMAFSDYVCQGGGG